MAGLKRTDNKGRILKDGESQRKDGTYRYRYTDADGYRHDVYSARLVVTDRAPVSRNQEKSLREKEKVIRRDLDDGIKAQVENRGTLNSFFDLYMSDKREIKESTRVNYNYMYDKYVRDTLGKRKISTIRYSDVKKFYNSLIHDLNFKPNSLEVIHGLLRPTFTLAVRDGFIRINPADGAMKEVKKGQAWKTQKKHALTIAEQEAFIAYVAEHPIYRRWLPLFTVLLGTGGRIGEITGLRWEDVDFEEAIITINHNLVYQKFAGDKKATFHVLTPKTSAGTRIIPMLDGVRDALQKEWEIQTFIGRNDSVVDGYTGFIFQNRYGDPLSGHNVDRAIERIVRDYNREETTRAEEENRKPLLLPHFSAHILRHTFCTRFCENESNIKVIQEIMGHADVETTMNIYAEATKEKKQEVFDNLEGKIKIS